MALLGLPYLTEAPSWGAFFVLPDSQFYIYSSTSLDVGKFPSNN